MNFSRTKVILIIAIFLVTTANVFQWVIPPAITPIEVIVTIPRGASTTAVAEILEEKGLIRSSFAFRVLSRVKSASGQIRAGRFILSPSFTMGRILSELSNQSGVAALVRVTVPEGYDLMQIGRILERAGYGSQAEFMTYVRQKAKSEFASKYPFVLDAPGDNLEGFFFPETYYFSKHDTYSVIVDAFLNQFKKSILPLWETAPTGSNAPKTRFNFYKVLTMASIIEKEARKQAEMPIISSVFYNRLKKMMPLGADPTVIYGLGLTTKTLVTYKDTESVSPYNTYKVFGFPPTPIASPGKAAFLAATAPKKTPYFFFVARKDGSHVFTKTYAEHLSVQRAL